MVAIKRENEIALSQVEKAQHHLFPQGKPQERVMNVFYYLTRYGDALIPALMDRFVIDLEAGSYAAPGRKTVVLPEGVDLQLTTAASEVVAENVGAIRFFPDGGSTGGRVDLNVNGREYVVHVAWLTGEARLEIPDEGA